MNHNNVISLPAGAAALQGQLVEVNSDGQAIPFSGSSIKEKAIGVVLHDVDPSEIGDAIAVHLFTGIFIGEAQGPIEVGDIVGTQDASAYLKNSGTLRQLGVALDAIEDNSRCLIRVVAS